MIDDVDERPGVVSSIRRRLGEPDPDGTLLLRLLLCRDAQRRGDERPGECDDEDDCPQRSDDRGSYGQATVWVSVPW